MEEEKTKAVPAKNRLTNDEKTWGILANLSAFLGFLFPFGNILGPLAVYLIKKEQSKFVANQGKEILNFQISLTIYSIILIILMFFTFLIGIILILPMILFALLLIVFILINVVEIIFIVIASVKASKGEQFHYPLSIPFVK